LFSLQLGLFDLALCVKGDKQVVGFIVKEGVDLHHVGGKLECELDRRRRLKCQDAPQNPPWLVAAEGDPISLCVRDGHKQPAVGFQERFEISQLAAGFDREEIAVEFLLEIDARDVEFRSRDDRSLRE
jgi:hypothetical protein